MTAGEGCFAHLIPSVSLLKGGRMDLTLMYELQRRRSVFRAGDSMNRASRGREM